MPAMASRVKPCVCERRRMAEKHAIPQDGDSPRVLADEERCQEVFHDGFDDPRRDRGVRFANAFDAAVCLHANQGG